jgi:hypothetical protein
MLEVEAHIYLDENPSYQYWDEFTALEDDLGNRW